MGTITEDHVEQHARRMDERSYSIHFHAWDNREFAEMLEAAQSAYDLPFKAVRVVPNQHEFIVILEKIPSGNQR